MFFQEASPTVDSRHQSTSLGQHIWECDSSLVVRGERRDFLVFLPLNVSCSGRGFGKRVES